MKSKMQKHGKKDRLIFDIGTSNIKIVEAEERHGYISVIRNITVPTPEHCFEEGAVKSVSKLADLIVNELSKGGFSTKNAIMTLTSPQILTREVVLPKSNLKDMMMLVEVEAPNHFPIDISEYSVDFKVLGEVVEDDIQQYRVLLLLTPLKILDSYVALFEKCGLFLEKIDYKGNSFAKLIKNIDEAEENFESGSTVVLDIGGEFSSVTICKDGEMIFSRVFGVGSKLYNAELLEYPGVTKELAEKIKYENGVVLMEEEENNDYAKAARQGWEKISGPLFDEISRVFDFYVSRESENMINRILLTGGGVLMPRLIRFISNTYDIRTDYLRCEGIIEFENPDEDMTMFSTYFSGCVGALLNE